MSSAGPWRITFVTNPDDCNLRCIMCRRQAVFVPRPAERGVGGQRCHGRDHTHRDPRTVGRGLVPRRGAQGGGAQGPALQDQERGDWTGASDHGHQPREPRRMEFALIERVVDEQRGRGLTELIPSTLGEPLLYPDMDRLVDLCARTGVRLNLTTNGTFPGRGARAWAQRLVPVTSDVKISWNGSTAATAEALMTGLRFERALQAAKDFIAVRDAAAAGASRCRVSFQVTANERNVAELPGIVELAAKLGVDRVKVNHLWIHFPQLEPLSLRRSPEALARWNAAVRASRRAAEQQRRPDGRPVLLQNFVELQGDPRSPAPLGECPFLGREAWVLADGRFAPCPAPRAAEGALGELGSLLDGSLAQIWSGERLRALRDGYAEHSVCRECRMRRPGGA